ncbi:hypothetical protein AeMF1_018150 [Aphanomyces euteiches]|nr:hypothetical protein AeMF1_018150 [Aphanomyces euteiches]KAH9190055.1 hypothetical protein AeNC1_007966 [Aphanomyces euteiches]
MNGASGVGIGAHDDGIGSPAHSSRSDRSVSLLDNRDAKVIKAAPTDDDILKESLHIQSSSKTCVTTATTQLKVLCRKFAVLSEKVKQEAKMREDAEKEIKRLNELLEDATNPLITSTRTDAQQYMRAQQEELNQVKAELHRTKEELFHVKQELEMHRANAAQPHQAYHGQPLDPQTQWDREQTSRIQETLSCTISELHEELSVKEMEIEALRTAVNREKAKHKDLEHAIAASDAQNREDKELLSKMTQDLRDMTLSQASEIEKLHVAQESVKEERSIKEALQHQITTLHQVNDALQKRCDALVRRLQLNANVATEAQSLKSLVAELETQNEDLVKTVRDLKQSHFQELEQLKTALHTAQTMAHEAEKRVTDVQGELNAMRVQNHSMSEYMMYGMKRASSPLERNPLDSQSLYSNPMSPLMSPTLPRQRPPSPTPQQQQQQQHQTLKYSPPQQSIRPATLSSSTTAVHSHQSNHLSSSSASVKTTPYQSYRPQHARETGNDQKQYVPQVQSKTSWSDGVHDGESSYKPETFSTFHMPEKEQTIKRMQTLQRGESDHSILRALKNRNKQLQERLQQEADATFQLEEEINMITSSYHTLLNNE